MQPALADVVQKSTLPDAAASASARLGARMSIPWCGPPGRGAPKSSLYCTGPRTGKTMGAGGFWAAPATPARRPEARRRKRIPRAVVRWRRIKLRFALEGEHPNTEPEQAWFGGPSQVGGRPGPGTGPGPASDLGLGRSALPGWLERAPVRGSPTRSP